MSQMKELLNEVFKKSDKGFKSDDGVSFVPDVEFDTDEPETDLDDLQAGEGKTAAQKNAEMKRKMMEAKKVKESDEEDKDSDEDEDSDDDVLKEALKMYTEAVENGEVDDEDELDEGRMKHAMNTKEAELAKAIQKKKALIHYYEKQKKSGTRYNKSKGPGSDLNNLKKEVEILSKQLKDMRAKSHPKNLMKEYAIKNIKENFNATDIMKDVFKGEDLSESFKTKVSGVFKAAVIERVSSLFEDAYQALSEEFENQKKAFAEELQEQYENEVEDLKEKMNIYIEKTINEWVENNKPEIINESRVKINESFMSKLKDLFEEHYIELPESKVNIFDELTEELEEKDRIINEYYLKNKKLEEALEKNEKEKIVESLSSNLSEIQKDKFKYLVESLDFDDEFESNAKAVLKTYFTKPSKFITEDTDGFVELSEPKRSSSEIEVISDIMSKFIKR